MNTVSLLAMGGTIASSGSGGAGVTPNLDGEAIVASVPQLAQVATMRTTSVKTTPSAEISIGDLTGVVEKAKGELRTGSDGIVVTQGTNMLEEAAFVLDLLWDEDAPMIVTGAMRNPTLPGPDGPANLVSAAAAAASPQARGLGVLVLFNDELHAARFVRKTHTTSLATFRSPAAGPLGWVAERRCRIAFQPRQRFGVRGIDASRPRRVALLQAVLTEDARLVQELERLGYEGLVVEASGPGHVSREWADALRPLATRLPVVLASRTGSGEILRNTYDFQGSEIDLLGAGLLPAGWLDARKARLLLITLLMAGATAGQVREAFDVVGRMESSYVFDGRGAGPGRPDAATAPAEDPPAGR